MEQEEEEEENQKRSRKKSSKDKKDKASKGWFPVFITWKIGTKPVKFKQNIYNKLIYGNLYFIARDLCISLLANYSGKISGLISFKFSSLISIFASQKALNI